MVIKRGILRAFDSATYTATVEVEGSFAYLQSVAVSRGIAAAELVAGRKVGVVFFEAGNPADAVLFAVWT